MAYTQSDYEHERAICDKAAAYVDQFRGRNGWASLTPEQAAHPDYAACDNDMRGRVEQWELLRDLPEKFCAYLSSDCSKVTVWTGGELGAAWVTSSRPN